MKDESRAVSSVVLPYGDRRIRCAIRRSQQRKTRSVAIHVESDGRVLVDAPLHATDQQIRVAVTRRLAWVHRQVLQAEERHKALTPREYVSGETVLYLGRRYRLKVVINTTAKGARLRGGYLEVVVNDRSANAVRQELEKWMRGRAREVLPLRLAKVAERLQWVKDSPPLSIRPMTRQWGSCSPNGRIALNVGLVRVPQECIDYVLLHELTHLKVHNHGRAFYRALDRHLPDWKRIKSRLDAFAELALAT